MHLPVHEQKSDRERMGSGETGVREVYAMHHLCTSPAGHLVLETEAKAVLNWAPEEYYVQGIWSIYAKKRGIE